MFVYSIGGHLLELFLTWVLGFHRQYWRWLCRAVSPLLFVFVNFFVALKCVDGR